MQPTATAPGSDHNGATPGNGRAGPSDSRRRAPDSRQLLPVLGLREYWYPAIEAKQVGRRKPCAVSLLGQDLVLFRGKDGDVVALRQRLPASRRQIVKRACDFKGTIACFYHGIGLRRNRSLHRRFRRRSRFAHDRPAEGQGLSHRHAEGHPVHLDGSRPARRPRRRHSRGFLRSQRPGIQLGEQLAVQLAAISRELRRLTRPVRPSQLRSHAQAQDPAPALPMPGKPYRVGPHRLAAAGRSGATARAGRRRAAGRPYQDYYPLLDAKWPKTRYRFAWTWLFDLTGKLSSRFWTPYQVSDDWDTGQHLPSIVRLNYGTHMYTRWCVPVGELETRMYYFHAARRRTLLGKLHEALKWGLFENWAMNKNFSEQDAPGAIHIYYGRPERLSISDQQTIEWRKMLLSARGMPPAASSAEPLT